MARGAGTTAAELDDLPAPTWRLLLGRGLPQFVAETILPVVAFYVAWQESGLVAGIVVSSVVSLAIAGWLVRSGRDTGPVLIGVAFIVIQSAVALAAHSTTVYLAQPVIFSVLVALGYLASIAVGKPAIGIFASAWYPFPEWFKNSTPFRREFGLQTLVWAVFMLLRAALRLWVLLNAGVGGFIVVSLLTGVPPYVLLVGWGIWHSRRSFLRLDVAGPDS